MKKCTIHIIHSPDVTIDTKTEASVFAMNGTCYILPTGETPENYMRSIYQAEKEKAEWIRKYDNLLKGLKYWKEKARERV